MFREINQAQNDKYFMFFLICRNLKKKKVDFIEEKWTVVTRGCESGGCLVGGERWKWAQGVAVQKESLLRFYSTVGWLQFTATNSTFQDS